MAGWNYLVILVVAALLVGAWFLVRKYANRQLSFFLKVAALTLFVIFMFRYLLRDEAFNGTVKFVTKTYLFPNRFLSFMALLTNWLFLGNILILTFYPYFTKVRYAVWLARTYSVLSTALTLLCLPLLLTAINGAGAWHDVNLLTILIDIELGFAICLTANAFLTPAPKLNVKDIGLFGLAVFAILVATMPAYAPQYVIGYINPMVKIEGFSFWHRIYLYSAFVLPFLVYLGLRGRSRETIKYGLLFLAVGGFITFMYNFRFDVLADPTRWPVHLCHTAMYIIPLCLIFKWNKVFYFTFFVNVLGAFFAMALPDMNGNMIQANILHFWNNHYLAFFMPILLIALRVYERPKLKQFIYSALAFCVYFVLVMILNAWFSNYGEVDFFYINSDFIAEKLGQWAEDTRKITLSFNLNGLHFLFYPLYQFLYWLIYVIMSSGMWFLYEQSYLYFDTLADMANRRKKYRLDQLALEIKLNGKEKTAPMNPANSNQLILKGLTKRYSSSDVYAVKDVNLEVHGGEIFGFLGPNGAGKSTIIKSIVGIQPITEGSIEVCGYDVQTQSIMAKKQIGFVPDHYALYEKLTGREYINYIADLYEVSQADRDERINRYVKFFELAGAFDNQMKTYSHGMKQKIAIMAALVHNPKVWILDEPLTGLDPNSIFQVKECMKNHAKAGNIVFFSSHIIDVVERICDRIGIIKKGQLQVVKPVRDIIRSKVPLEDFYMDIIENNQVQAIKVNADEENSDAPQADVNQTAEPKAAKPVAKKPKGGKGRA